MANMTDLTPPALQQILIVNHIPIDADVQIDMPVLEPGMSLALNSEPYEAQLKSSNWSFVLVLFDPCSRASVQGLQELHDLAQRFGLGFGAVANINPSWIENLMHQMGIKNHFTRFPRYTDLLETMA
ncbi:hypothetical protein [Epibacterium ulvae]|uniref:Uncharacterized protein n=1 Tax=Epibacterium ulvae TaxID=1156985 RepID=A0A1G5RAL7_9RHOB|nr:hypothetical protein [Epibacterium ulvae]SCZ70820.1 hypothetical protein SAMN04488118_11117 [Epibacterium ulvae]